MGDIGTFKWSNYTRPTPKNLEYLASSLRRIVAVIAGTTIIMGSSKWVSFGIILIGALLDEFKNFFAHVDESAKETLSVSFPSSMADKVEIAHDIESENNNSQSEKNS